MYTSSFQAKVIDYVLHSGSSCMTVALRFTFGLDVNFSVTFFAPQQQVQTNDDNKCTYDAEHLMRSEFQNYDSITRNTYWMLNVHNLTL